MDKSILENLSNLERLVNSLAPFVIDGQYSAGLDKLNVELDDETRMNVVYETVRRVQLSNSAIDVSAFAEFPVKKVQVGSHECLLDSLAQRILKDMLKRYNDRYTIGVYEACSSEELYKSYLKLEVEGKKKEAYSVPIGKYEELRFPNPALVPNFKVHSQTVLNGRNLKIVGLSVNAMLIQDKEQVVLERAAKCKVVFPSILNRKQNTNILLYEFVDSSKQDDGTYVSRFYFSPSNGDEKSYLFKQYLNQHLSVFPLVLDQELRRTKHSMERDLLVFNSPQIPVFCHKEKGEWSPVVAMMTEANQHFFPTWRNHRWFPEEHRLTALIQELEKYGHAIYLKGVVNQSGNRFPVCATLRELVKTDQLNRFIIACDPDSIMVIQCHWIRQVKRACQQQLVKIGPGDETREVLKAIDGILFCQNLSSLIGELVSLVDPGELAVPEEFVEHNKSSIPNIVVSDPLNERSENRFHLDDTYAGVYIGRIKQVEAQVIDISKHGLKLRFTKRKPLKLLKHVRVTIKSIKINRTKYRIVQYDPKTSVIRLRVIKKEASRTSLHLEKMFKDNATYFRAKNTFLANKQSFDVLFNLSAQFHRLPMLSLKSAVLDHQKLGNLYLESKPDFLTIDGDKKKKAVLTDFLAGDGRSLESKAIQDLLMHHTHTVTYIVDKESGRKEPLELSQLADEDSLKSLQQKLGSGKQHLKAITFVPVKAERLINRMQNRNLALLSNLDREAAFLAKGVQFEISHAVAIDDLSAIFTVCINFDVLIKSPS